MRLPVFLKAVTIINSGNSDQIFSSVDAGFDWNLSDIENRLFASSYISPSMYRDNFYEGEGPSNIDLYPYRDEGLKDTNLSPYSKTDSIAYILPDRWALDSNDDEPYLCRICKKKMIKISHHSLDYSDIYEGYNPLDQCKCEHGKVYKYFRNSGRTWENFEFSYYGSRDYRVSDNEAKISKQEFVDGDFLLPIRVNKNHFFNSLLFLSNEIKFDSFNKALVCGFNRVDIPIREHYAVKVDALLRGKVEGERRILRLQRRLYNKLGDIKAEKKIRGYNMNTEVLCKAIDKAIDYAEKYVQSWDVDSMLWNNWNRGAYHADPLKYSERLIALGVLTEDHFSDRVYFTLKREFQRSGLTEFWEQLSAPHRRTPHSDCQTPRSHKETLILFYLYVLTIQFCDIGGRHQRKAEANIDRVSQELDIRVEERQEIEDRIRTCYLLLNENRRKSSSKVLRSFSKFKLPKNAHWQGALGLQTPQQRLSSMLTALARKGSQSRFQHQGMQATWQALEKSLSGSETGDLKQLMNSLLNQNVDGSESE